MCVLLFHCVSGVCCGNRLYRLYRNNLGSRGDSFEPPEPLLDPPLEVHKYTYVWTIITSSPKGNDGSPESNMPRSTCPNTLCSLSPTPVMLHIKFDQDWPTGFRDIQVQKCEIFVTQGQVTPKWVVWFRPKSNLTELLRLSWLTATFMMIRSKMNKLAWRHHFPIISLQEFL